MVGGRKPFEPPPMWDGDGAWRDDGSTTRRRRTDASDPDAEEDACGRLLTAAQRSPSSRHAARGAGSSALAGEVSRLERALGPAAAAVAVKTCRDAAGRTAMMRAARSGDLDGVDACIRAACGVEPSTPGGAVAGADAADAEADAAVAGTRATSSCAASEIADGDRHGVGALTLAAWQGHTRVVDYLLRRGADVNRRDDFGVAALHKSVGHGHLSTVLRLLGDGGTDPNLRVGSISERIPPEYRAVSRHQTALHIACYRRQADGSQAPADARMVRWRLPATRREAVRRG